ncbi:MAG: hypothetical protein M0Z31_11390 [Clostridia bacterium]|nr:hypothetical protein [Clostridia bacterium]
MMNKYSYTISLPDFTSQEVIDWFETLAAANRLSDEVIALVYRELKTGGGKQTTRREGRQGVGVTGIQAKTQENHQDFLDNLYNWQESNNVLHKDERKREKKQMLSV